MLSIRAQTPALGIIALQLFGLAGWLCVFVFVLIAVSATTWFLRYALPFLLDLILRFLNDAVSSPSPAACILAVLLIALAIYCVHSLASHLWEGVAVLVCIVLALLALRFL